MTSGCTTRSKENAKYLPAEVVEPVGDFWEIDQRSRVRQSGGAGIVKDRPSITKVCAWW